jgi:glycosyltransferase involved in cell wall biosynthesis
MRIAILAAFPLHVIPGLEQHAQGGHHATWLPQLSQAFAAEEGWDIHWLTVAKRPAPTDPIRWRGQTFHCLHSPARGRLWRAYRPDRRAIRRRLDQLQPDLIHAWGTEDCYGLAGADAGRPWLLSMQGLLGEYIRRSRMHPFVWVQALYERSVLRQARDISVESRWGEAMLQRMAPHARTHLVEYGVQEPFYREPWQPDGDRPHAVFIGTVDPRKGVEDAVRAFAAPELQATELHIIGDAEHPYARRLRALSTPNVHWLGRLDSGATAEALRRAWCLILPTRADTSPNVVKEARVVGLPVITTPHGGQSDYIRDGENGFLCEPGDVAAFTRAAAKVLGDLAYARLLGAWHWEEQREFFQPAHTARRFLALYRELLEARHPAP